LKLQVVYDFAPNAVEKPMKKATMPAKIMLSQGTAVDLPEGLVQQQRSMKSPALSES
jgi:hypothetical protein